MKYGKEIASIFMFDVPPVITVPVKFSVFILTFNCPFRDCVRRVIIFCDITAEKAVERAFVLGSVTRHFREGERVRSSSRTALRRPGRTGGPRKGPSREDFLLIGLPAASAKSSRGTSKTRLRLRKVRPGVRREVAGPTNCAPGEERRSRRRRSRARAEERGPPSEGVAQRQRGNPSVRRGIAPGTVRRSLSLRGHVDRVRGSRRKPSCPRLRLPFPRPSRASKGRGNGFSARPRDPDVPGRSRLLRRSLAPGHRENPSYI